jgi:hypothetical protein
MEWLIIGGIVLYALSRRTTALPATVAGGLGVISTVDASGVPSAPFVHSFSTAEGRIGQGGSFGLPAPNFGGGGISGGGSSPSGGGGSEGNLVSGGYTCIDSWDFSGLPCRYQSLRGG